jgi:cardiolipin synthase
MHALLTTVANISDYAVYIIYLYLVVVVVFIIMENRDTSSTLAWILVFLLFPIIGFFVYIFFGRNWKVTSSKKKDRIRQIHKKTDSVIKKIQQKQERYITSVKEYNIERVLRVSQRNSDTLITTHNEVRIIQSGKEKFDLLEKDIKEATKFIHMEYFIWRDDKLTQRIADLLIQKTKEGVEVRIIYDPVGSFFTSIFHRGYLNNMKKNGVQIVAFFNALSPLRITTVNYLLHRKIIVIDGKIGYTGGMNMGQEYVDGGKFGYWRDTHLRLRGDAVAFLHSSFAVNWEEVKSESLFNEKYFPIDEIKCNKRTTVQVIPSEPDSYWQPIKQSIFAIIMTAKEQIYIQSPYFIPDQTLLEALKNAALSGVKVKIMMTGIPDKYIPFWAAFTYFEELLRAGVKIYHYSKGFLHSKTISVDGSICSIGTTNMDIRSLHLSYENNVIIYDENITQQMQIDYEKDLKDCREFTLEDYEKIPLFVKFRNSVVRLLSPLL